MPPTAPVEWLHYPIVPRLGAIAIFGAGGAGKSGLVAAEIAARFTVGGFDPVIDRTRASREFQSDGPLALLVAVPPNVHAAPGTCESGYVWWYSGDSGVTAHADVERAEGNCALLDTMTGEKFDAFPDNAEQYRGSLVVADAPQAKFFDENSNTLMRSQIEKYAKAAEAAGVLLVLILHPKKLDLNDHRLLHLDHLRGASSIGQTLRLVIEMAVHPDGQLWTGLVKSNLGPGAMELAWHATSLNAQYRFTSGYMPWPAPVGKVRAYADDREDADEVFLSTATELWNHTRATGKHLEQPEIVGRSVAHQTLCRGRLSENAYKDARERLGFRVKGGLLRYQTNVVPFPGAVR